MLGGGKEEQGKKGIKQGNYGSGRSKRGRHAIWVWRSKREVKAKMEGEKGRAWRWCGREGWAEVNNWRPPERVCTQLSAHSPLGPQVASPLRYCQLPRWKEDGRQAWRGWGILWKSDEKQSGRIGGRVDKNDKPLLQRRSRDLLFKNRFVFWCFGDGPVTSRLLTRVSSV